MPRLDELPLEIIQMVGDHLDNRALANFAKTSRKMNGTLQRRLANAVRQYALADETEYKKRMAFDEHGNCQFLNLRLETPRQPLVEAIWARKINVVSSCLLSGIDPNSYDLGGRRLLSHAVYSDCERIVDLLLKHGANPALPNMCPRNDSTVATAAQRTGNDPLVRKLIIAGADVTEERARAALAAYCSLDTIKIAMDKGADFGQVHSDGSTVFHHAARNMLDQDVLPFFIEKYRDQLSSQNIDGKTALFSAICVENLYATRCLMAAGIDTNLTDHDNENALHFTFQVAERILPHIRQEHFREAFREEILSLVRALLESGVQVSAQTPQGLTALHLAASVDMPEIVSLLLTSDGVDVNARTANGETPLHIAADAGLFDIVRVLVEQGNANVSLRNSAGRKPEYLARIQSSYTRKDSHTKVAEYLAHVAAN